MGKASEAEDIDVHDPASWMHQAQVLLRLHRKLLRHKDKIILLRMPDGLLYDILIQTVGFSAAGIAEYKL